MALKVEDRVQFILLRSHQCHTRRQEEGDGDQGEAVRVDFEQMGWKRKGLLLKGTRQEAVVGTWN